jgi:hypothetical protein
MGEGEDAAMSDCKKTGVEMNEQEGKTVIYHLTTGLTGGDEKNVGRPRVTRPKMC